MILPPLVFPGLWYSISGTDNTTVLKDKWMGLQIVVDWALTFYPIFVKHSSLLVQVEIKHDTILLHLGKDIR